MGAVLTLWSITGAFDLGSWEAVVSWHEIQKELILSSLLTSIARLLSNLRASFVHLEMPIQAISREDVSRDSPQLGQGSTNLRTKGFEQVPQAYMAVGYVER